MMFGYYSSFMVSFFFQLHNQISTAVNIKVKVVQKCGCGVCFYITSYFLFSVSNAVFC